jgi:hypothetical protein
MWGCVWTYDDILRGYGGEEGQGSRGIEDVHRVGGEGTEMGAGCFIRFKMIA